MRLAYPYVARLALDFSPCFLPATTLLAIRSLASLESYVLPLPQCMWSFISSRTLDLVTVLGINVFPVTILAVMFLIPPSSGILYFVGLHDRPGCVSHPRSWRGM
jgi:hypothetical protein